MRYALRNQDKLKEAFGDDGLKRMKDSLDSHFKEMAVLQVEKLEGDKYPTMAVHDRLQTITFFVTTQMFDVVHLAFKGFSE